MVDDVLDAESPLNPGGCSRKQKMELLGQAMLDYLNGEEDAYWAQIQGRRDGPSCAPL